jgi:beta-lactamase regulating signal transducer with metallopeptidase domain
MNVAWAWAGLAEITPWLLRFTVAGTLVTAFAHVLGSTLLRQLAIARVAVWRTTAAALLLVPVLSLMLPGKWTLPGGFVVFRPDAEPMPALIAPPVLVRAAPPVALDQPDAPAQTQLGVADGLQAILPIAEVLTTSVEASSDAVLTLPEGPGWAISPFSTIALVWVVVACWFLLQLIAGIVALDMHARRAINVTKDVAHVLSAGARRRHVRVLRGGPFRVPVCWGIFRPRILLPFGSGNWSPERLSAVLLHEGAHVERRDGLFLIIARVACAVHWLNPFAWGLLRRLSVDSEAACDSAVLRAGVPPRYYAKVLVEVASEARRSRRPEAAMALALLRTGTLTWRVTRILDPRAMAPVRRWVTTSVAAVLMVVTLAGATVTLEADAPEQPASEAAPVEAPTLQAQRAGEVSPTADDLVYEEPASLGMEVTRSSPAVVGDEPKFLIGDAPVSMELAVPTPRERETGLLDAVRRIAMFTETVSRAGVELPVVADDAPAPPPRRPRITGTLREVDSNRPIQGARLALVDERGVTLGAVITDRNGAFSIAAPGPGDYNMATSALGYQEMTFGVEVNDDVTVSLPIKPTPLPISGLVVVADAALTATGFYERSQAGVGRFFGPKEIAEAVDARIVTDLLRTVPRVSVLPEPSGYRVAMSGPTGQCGPRIFVDWMLVSPDGRQLDQTVPLGSLEALEVYRSPSQTPLQWSGNLQTSGPCGAIVAWTKR